MELGNLAFNFANKNQVYECPDFIVALLKDLEDKISIIYWNKNQKEWDSAFRNTGNQYHNGVFDVYAYRWDGELQPYNFKYQGIEISWYKYLGRDTSINIDPESEGFNNLMIEMYNSCLEVLRRVQEEDFD